MALGGGSFVTQNKVLPGTYINFVSVASASPIISERGLATMPLELDWGIDNEVFEVTYDDMIKNSIKIFGYDYTHEKLKGLRDLFKNIRILYCYKLTSDGIKASNAFAIAKYCGIRGNDLKIVIKVNIDDTSKFDVVTMFDDSVVDTQIVADKEELVSNDYVDFKDNLVLNATAGVPLVGGSNGTVNGASHQSYLNKIESYSFNAMGVLTTDDTIKSLYSNFCRRLRDEVGNKFQLVIHDCAADYMGVVSVKNRVLGDIESSMVYFTTGLIAGCAVNKSNQNKIYNGEFKVDTNYTQNQLADSILSGEFVYHKVLDDIRVLDDINSKVTVTLEEDENFKDNQTIRLIDQIAIGTASIFNTKFMGSVPNDESGRISFWSAIVKLHEELKDIRAIENFSDKDITISQGNHKKSIVVNNAVTVINTMTKLYMSVKVG